MTITSVNDSDSSHAAEGALVEAALSGDGLAFRKLVEPHLAMLHRIATRVGGSASLAEDAVQETLALTYQKLPGYRHETPFKAFLAAIAARQAHTLARSERRRNKRELSTGGPQHLANPEEALQGAVAARKVREALSTMPEKRRAAALLRLDGGLSYRDIGAALGSTEGSARVLVHMALKDLKQRLSELLDEEK